MSDPRPSEFEQFHELLTENAPDGYRPWYFRVRSGSKAPATKYGSWKEEDARLSYEEALEWLKDGGNVGIAGTADDELVNVDIDDEDETTPDDLKETLIARSRSRTGVHAWYFETEDTEIPNIPTDEAGEVRANWQYVVAPGSYVETDPEKVPDEHIDAAGYYTVERPNSVTSLRFDELPSVFKQHQEATEQEEKEPDLQNEPPERDGGDNGDRRSDLHDITAKEVVQKEGGSTEDDDRWSAIWHGSGTESNMNLSSKGLIQCWRHNVAHNGLQALVTLSDYKHDCEKVGTPHDNSNAGDSCIKQEDGAAVWHAWKYAKENGYIPDDDPVPYSALLHVCQEREICTVAEIPDSKDESLPEHAYNGAIESIENYDELNSGRKRTDEIDDSGGIPNKSNVEPIGDNDTDNDPSGNVSERGENEHRGNVSTKSENDTEQKGNFGSISDLETFAGGYGYIEVTDSGEEYFERVTNFEIDVESFLKKDGDRLIDMEVVPGTGEELYEVTVPAKVFNDTRRFRDNVVTGLTTTYDGAPSDLNELRKKVGGQDAPIRQGTHHMGLHPEEEEFVTPNGVLTADGWIDDPTVAYIEREITAERSCVLDPEHHDNYDPADVADMLELLPKTRNAERFLPVLGWMYTAPLRPFVQKWQGQFNTLHVTGETGAGKSSTLSLLWKLLGMDGDPMACDDTKFALTTTMASSRSIPMWFDEYKPGDMKDWELDRFQTLMRKSTRGGVETRGNADKTTEEYRLQAPLVISGEQAVQGAAEERRSVQTRFRDNVKDPQTDTKEAFAQLTGMAYDDGGQTVEPEGYELQQHALAYYQFVLQQDEDRLKDLWRQSREYVRELLTEHDITGVDDLPRQGIQTVHFGITLYEQFGGQIAAEAAAEDISTPQEAEIETALLYIARQFGDRGSRKSHLDRFVELAGRAAAADYLEADEHYTVVNEGKPDEQLAFKLPRVHDSVSKYVRDHGLDGEDLLNNARDYKERMKEAAKSADSYVDNHSKNTRPLNRCARLDVEAAETQLHFDRTAFGLTSEEEKEDQEGMRPHEPDPIDVAAIDPQKQDNATVEAEIRMEKYDGFDGEEGTPAWSATLDDGTDTAQLVVWDEENIPRIYDNRGVIKHDAVRVCGARVGEFNGEVQLTVGDLGTVVGIEQTPEDQSDVTEAQEDNTTATDDTTATATDGGDTPEDDDPAAADTTDDTDTEAADDDDTDTEAADDDDTDTDGDTPLRPSLIENGVKNINTQYDSGDEVTAASYAGSHGLSGEQGEAVLEHLTTEKGLLERLDDGYRVL